MKVRLEQVNQEWQLRVSKLEEEMVSQKGDLEKRLETINVAIEKENSLEADMELLRVKLSEAEVLNSQLKGDFENLRKENIVLFDKSVDDTNELVNITKQNETLVSMVVKESTLGEDDVAFEDSVNTVVPDHYSMDPMGVDDTVFDDKIGVSGKHSLSPISEESGLPSAKIMAVSSQSETSVIQTIPVNDSPASMAPPSHSPPPLPPPPPIKTKIGRAHV